MSFVRGKDSSDGRWQLIDPFVQKVSISNISLLLQLKFCELPFEITVACPLV